MSSNVVVCTIDQDLKDELKKFRYSKAKEGTAIIMKVQKEDINGFIIFKVLLTLSDMAHAWCTSAWGVATLARRLHFFSEGSPENNSNPTGILAIF